MKNFYTFINENNDNNPMLSTIFIILKELKVIECDIMVNPSNSLTIYKIKLDLLNEGYVYFYGIEPMNLIALSTAYPSIFSKIYDYFRDNYENALSDDDGFSDEVLISFVFSFRYKMIKRVNHKINFLFHRLGFIQLYP